MHEQKTIIAGIIAALYAAASTTGGLALYSAITGTPVLTYNPVAIPIALLLGRQPGGLAAWLTIIGVAVAIAVPIIIAWRTRTRNTPKRTRGDKAARTTGTDTRPLSQASVQQKADRMGVDIPGLPVGIAVRNGKQLYTSWEDVSTIIAGQRTGKTTSWVIPRILAAPGPVLVTSNKRDVVDATRYVREQRGHTPWIFDPQGVVGNHTQACWWDPLTFVTGPSTATKLANVIVDANNAGNESKGDPFWENTSRDLVACYLLAAKLGQRPITDTYTWVNDDTNGEAAQILTEHGENLWATRLTGINNMVADTRSGVYAGAATMLAFLAAEGVTNWITPQPNLAQFQPEQFVTSNDTLYALSLEGGGDAAPILAALTVAVAEAGLAKGATSPAGRLPQPMLIELDEAANICPWRELPNQYSHFGSRGIVVDTILQSWSQGVDVWGESGMKKLWGPANLAAYLGGSKEVPYLKDLSSLIGDTWEDRITITNTGRSKALKAHREPIATISDLASLPLGRGWIFASGATPTLIQTQPWTTGPQANEINKSIRQSSP